jgi:hypothetical protein
LIHYAAFIRSTAVNSAINWLPFSKLTSAPPVAPNTNHDPAEMNCGPYPFADRVFQLPGNIEEKDREIFFGIDDSFSPGIAL